MHELRFGLPDVVEIEPTESCNLRCRMCHVSGMQRKKRPLLDPALLRRLSCLAGKHVIVGSGFEPMVHPRFLDIVAELSDLGLSIELITNGTLLGEEARKSLARARLRIVTFSFDGIRKGSYEYIRRGAAFERTRDNISAMLADLSGRPIYTAVNTTMLKANQEEIPEIVDYWDRAAATMVRFVVMVIRSRDPEILAQSLYFERERYFRLLDQVAADVIERQRRVALRSTYFVDSPLRQFFPQRFAKDALISRHPGARIVPTPRQDYQLGVVPGMPVACRSPFSFARILPSAEVQLCYRFPVGNLSERSFEAIWYGEVANSVRKRLRSDGGATCSQCDYYRFCLNSQSIDLDDKRNYFAQEMLDLAQAPQPLASFTARQPQQISAR